MIEMQTWGYDIVKRRQRRAQQKQAFGSTQGSTYFNTEKHSNFQCASLRFQIHMPPSILSLIPFLFSILP